MLKKSIVLSMLVFSSPLFASVNVYYKDSELSSEGLKKLPVVIQKTQTIQQFKDQIHTFLRYEFPKQFLPAKTQIFCGENKEPMANNQIINTCQSNLNLVVQEDPVVSISYKNNIFSSDNIIEKAIDIPRTDKILDLKNKIYTLIKPIIMSSEIFCKKKSMTDTQKLNECDSKLDLLVQNNDIYFKDYSLDSNNVKKLNVTIKDDAKILALKKGIYNLTQQVHTLAHLNGANGQKLKVICGENAVPMDNNKNLGDCNSKLVVSLDVTN